MREMDREKDSSNKQSSLIFRRIKLLRFQALFKSNLR